jgi:hypothetical protein
MIRTKQQFLKRYEKARKKRKVEHGFRGKVKKFILDLLSKKEIADR